MRERIVISIPLLLMCLIFILFIPASALLDSEGQSIEIKCDFPGKVIEAGDEVTFDIVVFNRGPEWPRNLFYETYGPARQWDIKFIGIDDVVHKIDVPTGGVRNVMLVVKTTDSTPPGDYSIRLDIGDGTYWVYVKIPSQKEGLNSLSGTNLYVENPTISATSDKSIIFTMNIKNNQRKSNQYLLGINNPPPGWYIRYKENIDSFEEISDIYIESGREKTLFIEAIPPVDTIPGEYHFISLVNSSLFSYETNLTAKIRGYYNLKVSANQYRYPIKKGDSLTFDLLLSNTGNAGPITNIRTNVSAPEGWNANVVPDYITNINPNDRVKVTISLMPPSNIPVGDYKITIDIHSDQMLKSDEFRILIEEPVIIVIFAVFLIITVMGISWIIFKKYKRK